MVIVCLWSVLVVWCMRAPCSFFTPLLLALACASIAHVLLQVLSSLEGLFAALPASGEEDAVHRALLSLGTLVGSDATLATFAADLGLRDAAQRYRASAGKLSGLATEVVVLLCA